MMPASGRSVVDRAGTRHHRRVQGIRAAHAFDGQRFLPGGATVIIDGDRIVGVETNHVDLPANVEVAEYAGTVMPGLIDCHTHLIADASFGGLERAGSMSDEEVDRVIIASLRAHAAAGVTTVRDLGDIRYRTLGFRSSPGLPRVVASGPPITTPGGHCHFLGGAVSGLLDADLRSAVAERVTAGVDVIKVMASGGFATPETDALGAQFTAAQLAVLVGEAHGAGLPLVAHAHSLVGMENALSAGVDGFEHFSGLSSAHGSRIEDQFLEEVARRGVYVDLTMGNDRSFHALMTAPPPPIAELMKRFDVSSFDEFYASRISDLSRFWKHKIRVITGVDSGMTPAKQHGNLWRVVGEMVEGGCSAVEALAAATSGTARACGLGAETGRLAPGYAADVLVVDGDLSQDVSALSRPRAVVVNGTPAHLERSHRSSTSPS
jgi:imidazolonepropionase-like amidohydrolase